MIESLPKILDRDFAVGYVLPSTIFLGASAFLWARYGVISISAIETLKAENPWLGLTLVALIVWLFALLLLAANRMIIRLKEGYWPWNRPHNPLVWWQRRRFKKLAESVEHLNELIPSPATEKELIRHSQHLATHFPADESFILPFAFGNTLRACEAYPLVMYGFEATVGWTRLLAVLPKDYRDLLDGAKARMDLWVNLWFLSLVLVAEYGIIALSAAKVESLWVPLAAAGGVVFFSFFARQDAVYWGELIKASFDVFLPDLCRKLRLGAPASRQEEKRMWTGYSQAILYRLPESLPMLELPFSQHKVTSKDES